MIDFERMTNDEFNAHLSSPVREVDQYVRACIAGGDGDLVDDYRQQLADLDRMCSMPVARETAGAGLAPAFTAKNW